MTSLECAVAVAAEPILRVLRQTVSREVVNGFTSRYLVRAWALHHAMVACLVEQQQFGRITPDFWEVAVTDDPVEMFVRHARWTEVQDWAPPVETAEDLLDMVVEDVAA